MNPTHTCVVKVAGWSLEPPLANILLAECARRELEGIVAKRKDATYRSGTRSSWIKVKTSEWKADNRWRGEFFEKT